MTIDIGQVAAAIVTTLAPFTPFLIEMGKVSGKRLAEVITEKGSDAAWEKAQALWDKLKVHFGDDPEVQSAAAMVAAKPEDETRQTMLAEVLVDRLQGHSALAKELLELVGGQESIQQVLADRSSWVENVAQRMTGKGKQVVEATDNSIITDVRQTKK
jgi:hypothetical protein